MANVLMLSLEGDGIPIALRLAKERHKVDIFLKNQHYKECLKGYKNPTILLKEPANIDAYDLVLADMVGLGELCDRYRQKGKIVLGGGVFNDKLELDRMYGSKVMSSLCKDVKEANSVKISTKEQLLAYLKKSVTAKVIKPLGNKSVSLTLVSKDDSNIGLVSIAEKMADKLVPCMIQEKIKGLEISTEGWFNGERFVKPFNHTFERKRFLENDKGPQTGCMGNVVVLTQSDRLTKMVLEPLEPLLKKVKYCGPLDVNCIIANKQVYFLEFTARIGYDAIQAMAELIKMSLYDFFFHIATKGEDLVEQQDFNYFKSMAVRLSMPPYPSKQEAEKWKGIRVLNISEGAAKHVWLADVMKEQGVEVLAGTDNVIGCVTARGMSISECQRRVYRTIDNIVVNSDVQYRADIGVQAMLDFEEFSRWCDDAKDTDISN